MSEIQNYNEVLKSNVNKNSPEQIDQILILMQQMSKNLLEINGKVEGLDNKINKLAQDVEETKKTIGEQVEGLDNKINKLAQDAEELKKTRGNQFDASQSQTSRNNDIQEMPIKISFVGKKVIY